MKKVGLAEEAVGLAETYLAVRGVGYGRLIGVRRCTLSGREVWLVLFELRTSQNDIDLGVRTTKVIVDVYSGEVSEVVNM